MRALSAWQRRLRRQPGALPLCLSAPPASRTNGFWREAVLAREQWQERRSPGSPRPAFAAGGRLVKGKRVDARKVLFVGGRRPLQRRFIVWLAPRPLPSAPGRRRRPRFCLAELLARSPGGHSGDRGWGWGTEEGRGGGWVVREVATSSLVSDQGGKILSSSGFPLFPAPHSPFIPRPMIPFPAL